jgi:hypothetical protein
MGKLLKFEVLLTQRATGTRCPHKAVNTGDISQVETVFANNGKAVDFIITIGRNQRRLAFAKLGVGFFNHTVGEIARKGRSGPGKDHAGSQKSGY